MERVYVVVSAMLLWFRSLSMQAPRTVATDTNVIVPPPVSFSGVSTGVNGKPLTGGVSGPIPLHRY